MDTIKSSADISDVFSHGKRLHTPYLTIITKRRALPTTKGEKNCQHDHSGRVAFVAGKKNGNAVWRNSAKRRMRALCSDLNGPWENYDVVFLAKSSLTSCIYSKVLQVCENELERAGIARKRCDGKEGSKIH